ncbi:MAG TPA: hypothetical protein VMM56_03405 [Planctomycetaceae bacterium]|nr:hypothetical protein [Planctomycetaceae bacterium]
MDNSNMSWRSLPRYQNPQPVARQRGIHRVEIGLTPAGFPQQRAGKSDSVEPNITAAKGLESAKWT